MMFLLRTAFWVSVALALLPSFAPRQAATAPPEVGTADAMTAASETVADLSGFCARRPEACAAGVQFANAFGQRAQAGARILYEFVGEKLARTEHGNPAAAVAQTSVPSGTPTGTHAGATVEAAAEAAKPSQNTLTATDMAPLWRGPQHRRDAPARRTS
jgi:hypothetical protein